MGTGADSIEPAETWAGLRALIDGRESHKLPEEALVGVAIRGEVAALVFIEGLILTTAGIILGLLLGHGGLALASDTIRDTTGLALHPWRLAPSELIALASMAACGVVALGAGSRRGANSDFILERLWRDSASKGRVRRAEGPTSSASVPPRAPRETDVEKMACDQQRASTATRRSERAQPSYVFDNAPDLGAERPCDLFEAPARAIRRSSAHTRSRHAHFCRPGG